MIALVARGRRDGHGAARCRCRPDAEERDVFGGLTNAMSVATAAAFVVSVIYESAYFWVVGSNFLSVASLADYLANVLDWLPGAITVVLSYWLGFMLLAMASGLALERNEPAPKKADKPSVWDKIPFPVIAILMIIFFCLADAYVYFHDDPATIGWLFGTLVMSFVAWSSLLSLAISRAGFLGDMIDDKLRALVLFVPILAFAAFLCGLHSGYRDLRRTGELYHLTLKDSQTQTPLNVIVLRAFERGILVRWPERKVTEFFRWEGVRSISLLRDGQTGKSLSCRQLGWRC